MFKIIISIINGSTYKYIKIFQYTVGYTDSIENFGLDSYKSGPRLVIPITPPP